MPPTRGDAILTPMAVPLFDPTRQHEALRAPLEDAFQRVLTSGQYILGQEVEAFEAEMADWLGVAGSVGVSSGTDALLVSLLAAGIGPGDEVLVPAFTFFASASCIRRVGAEPVFVDTCPACFLLRPEDARARLTERTRAILPVHLFGQAADLDPLLALAAAHGLTVLEDAAQSLGARHKGAQTGTVGDYGAFSFFPTKNLGGLGDGGLLLARHPDDLERARVLRVHGMQPKYHHRQLGGNFRLDALQAALLRVKLPFLEESLAARRRHALAYAEELAGEPGVLRPAAPDPATCPCGAGSCLPGEEEARLVLPFRYPDREGAWNQFTVRLPHEGDRDGLAHFLRERGIGTEIYYPKTLPDQPCFSAENRGPYPGAAQAARECLSLPLYPELREEERAEVIVALRDWLRS